MTANGAATVATDGAAAGAAGRSSLARSFVKTIRTRASSSTAPPADTGRSAAGV